MNFTCVKHRFNILRVVVNSHNYSKLCRFKSSSGRPVVKFPYHPLITINNQRKLFGFQKTTKTGVSVLANTQTFLLLELEVFGVLKNMFFSS